MARSVLANQTFNTLYTGMRSVASSRGVTYNVKTFNDGSAVINLIVTAKNVSVTQSVCIVPLMSDDEKSVEKWRVSDDEKVKIVKNLPDAINQVRSLIAQTRSILNKV